MALSAVNQTKPVDNYSLARKIGIGVAGAALLVILIYLLASLILYFFNRTQALQQKPISATPLYNLTGYDATTSAVLAPGGPSSGVIAGTSYLQPAPYSSSTTITPGSSAQPSIVYVPDNTSNPGTTTVVTPAPNNPFITIPNLPSDIFDLTPLPTLPVTFNPIVIPTIVPSDPSSVVPQVITELQQTPSQAGITVPQILPDNPLYGVKELNRSIQNLMTIDPLTKTGNYLTQANKEYMEGLTLLQEDIDDTSNTLAANTLQTATNNVQQAGDQLTKTVSSQTNSISSLLQGSLGQLMIQQIVLGTAEDIPASSIGFQIENIRIQHLVNLGVIVSNLIHANNNNPVTILPALVNTTIQNPISTLNTITALNNLQGTMSVDPAISSVQQTLVGIFGQQLLNLPANQQINVLAGYIGKSPLHLIQSIQILDNVDSTIDNRTVQNVTHLAADLATVKLQTFLTQLPSTERLAFLRHFDTGQLRDLQTLVMLDTRLRKTLANLNDTDNDDVLRDINSVKTDALGKTIARITHDPITFAKDPYLQHLLDQPSIYNLALLDTLQQQAQGTVKTPLALQAITNAKDIGFTKFVTSLYTNQGHLLPIPSTQAILQHVSIPLTPQAQTILAQATQSYNQNLTNYIITQVNDKNILGLYQKQLQTLPDTQLSSLNQVIITKIQNPTATVVPPTVTQSIPAPVQHVVEQVIPTITPTNSRQQSVQQVPAVIHTVTGKTELPSSQPSSSPNNSSGPLNIQVPQVNIHL